MDRDLPFLLALHSIEGLGPAGLKKLLDFFGSFESAWKSSSAELSHFKLSEELIGKLKKAKDLLNPEEYFLSLQKKQINVITIFDENYPELLRQIHSPPIIIYYKGEINNSILENCFAVVGTRKPTGYGRQVTEKLTGQLSEAGLVIVSGLARGVDTVAHFAALEAGGKTLAVLGGGLSNIFPSENIRLAEKISLGNGAVLTEFPPDYPHLAGNFPARNRIISGLSKGVLVTEAAEDSGSLITARFALDQNRDVFAVPGPITSAVSEGTLKLIREGAKLVSSANDILEELNITAKSSVVNVRDLTGAEAEIIGLINSEPHHVDEISRELRKNVAEISGLLLKLEISGLVKNLGGGNYIKS